MRLAVSQWFAIARLTALEAARQPIVFLLGIGTVLLISFLPMVLSHTMGESAKFVRDGSLAFMLLSGLILGAYAACATLTLELRRGTVSVVLSKPVDRAVFFLAKYAGIGGVLIAYAAGITLATMLSVRAAVEPYVLDWRIAAPLLGASFLACLLAGLLNFYLRRPFPSNACFLLLVFLSCAFIYGGFYDQAGNPVPFASLYDLRIITAAVLITLAILVLAGLSVVLATRFSSTPTLSICSAALLLGLLSDYMFGRHADTSWIAKILHMALPNWQHFWVVDVLAGPGAIPLAYVGQASLYALLYLTGICCLAVVSFKHMELKL
jgi:hypothetical protein